MNIFIDIETIPQQPEEAAKFSIGEGIKAPAAMKKQETIDAWHRGEDKYAGEKEAAIEEQYRKTSFDATKGQLASISWAINDGEIEHCADYEYGNQEKDLLKFFFDNILLNLGKSAPYFIGHYVGEFDLKFIWHRSVILGVRPPFELPFNGRHKFDYYCTMKAWAGWKDKISMNDLANALGIEGKGDMDGSKVWDEWKAGNFAKVSEYNVDDVRMVREIYNRLTFNV